MELKGIKSVAVMCTLNVVQFAFVRDAVEIYCTKNIHEIICTDDIITAMNEAVNR